MIIIEHSGIRAAFLSAAIILLLNLAYSACVVPESLPLDRRKPVSLVEANPVGAVECLLSHKGPDRTAVALVTAAFCCVHCADSMLRATWVNFTQVMFDWPMARAAAVFMVLGLSMGCIPRPLISAFGEEGAMQLAAGSFAVAFAFLALVPDERAVIAVVPLMCVGFAAPPTMLGWLAVHFDAKSQGSVMGACETVKTAAYVVGSWVGSTVFAKLISADRTSPDFQPQSVYLISCGLDIIALILLRCAFSRVDNEQSLTTRQ
jgi:DHA1 family tetracycline resistance protein-like MFS transporter